MTAMRFVDTNVLLYSISNEPKERKKATRALELLESEDLAVSVQVLQEFYVQATRRRPRQLLTHQQALLLVESLLLRYPAQENTVAVMNAAIHSCTRYQVSYWDASVIEAARALGCLVILSEDLNDGQDYGGIRVENPFRR